MTESVPNTEGAPWTPGPWRIVIYAAGRWVHWEGFKQKFWSSARGDREMLANARLIAAAPEMAEYIRRQAAAGDSDAIAIMDKIHASS